MLSQLSRYDIRKLIYFDENTNDFYFSMVIENELETRSKYKFWLIFLYLKSNLLF